MAFVAPAQRPDPVTERAHYGTHQNDPGDARYRAFLDRLAAPLVRRLPAGARGLDYGAGPGPTLSRMLIERGFPTAVYDPFFDPEPASLRRTYDFVTCTEAAEHFFSPAREFQQLDHLLRPGGWLGVMTQMLDDGTDLREWHYARDPTHVCFYHPRTMEWIAAHYGWTLQCPHPSVALFRKPLSGQPAACPPRTDTSRCSD